MRPGVRGQLGHVGVQIHPVNALQFHDDVFFLELGEAVGYLHGEFRLGICSPLWEQPPLVGNTPVPSRVPCSSTGLTGSSDRARGLYYATGPQTGEAAEPTIQLVNPLVASAV